MEFPETKFKKKVMSDLKTIDKIWFFKSQEVSVRGIPDIIFCLKGVFFALELKSAKGKASKLQKYNLEKIKEAGGIAFEVFPKDWDNFFEKLKEFNSEGLAFLL